MCGELAGDSKVAPVLVGLGLNRMSMNGVAIPVVKDVIRSSNRAELTTLAKGLVDLPSTAKVVEAVAAALAEKTDEKTDESAKRSGSTAVGK